ncbi:MAG: ABC transporter permease [Flammeovirgaceae bacterium]|nr:MAG: ABC transporter permease [Flammeovirgaceae bacterium]
MIKNYLLITIRSMMKNKIYLFINILGMAIAIACCIVGYYNYDFNASFDEYHTNRHEIYRVNLIREFQGKFTEYGYVPLPLGAALRENVKDVEAVTRYSSVYADVRIGDEIFDTRLSYVDSDFITMFTLEVLDGSLNAIQDKSRVLISDELALRLYGTVQAAGKPFTHILTEGRVREYEVGGVYKLPPTNSSFNDNAFTHYENFWDLNADFNQGSNWYFRNTVFVQLKDVSRINAIEEQLKPYKENNNKVREDFIISGFALDPLVGMAVRDEYASRPGRWTRNASPLAAVVGVGVMGIFVLLIACFNLTNTSIAISSRRLKEIGIRKVMGSMRQQLIVQFIGETMLVCFMALLLGMVIADLLLLPAFNALWPYMKLTTNYLGKPDFTIVMMLTLLFTGLLAGSYPAFYISKFQPTAILKGKLKFGGTNYFTRILLALQFAISLIGIVCSIAFTQNAKYQQEFDMGFKQREVLFTWVNSESEFNALRDVMAQNPDVISIAGAEHHLFSNAYNDPIKHEDKEIEADILNVGDNYLATAGLTLLQGRDFIKDSETDRKESVIITERVASLFGWDKPLGKEIIWMDTVKLFVVGVVKDIYNNGLWEDFDPVMFRYSATENYRHLVLTAPLDKIVGVNSYMEEKWKTIFPNRKFASRYMDDQLVEATTVNNNIVKMFIFLGIVAVLLSITGLFTLVSLNIIKKMKEIGVRKVLGASVANISRVINAEFVVILLIACLFGSWGGAWMSEMLMDSIWDFYQKATLATLVISSVIILAAATLTVSLKTYNTARMNPVNVLRDE